MKILLIVLFLTSCMPKVNKKFDLCVKDNEYITEQKCIEIELREK